MPSGRAVRKELKSTVKGKKVKEHYK
jgi:hypothetical protein